MQSENTRTVDYQSNVLDEKLSFPKKISRAITNVLIALGGGNPVVIRALGDNTEIASEVKKFRNIGYMLILPFAIATLSMTLIIEAAGDVPMTQALIPGVIWGVLMVVVDKTLLSQIATIKGFRARFSASFLRILLVMFMSLISMYFIEVSVFKTTITEEIKAETAQKKQVIIDEAQIRKDTIQAKIDRNYAERQARMDALAAEAAGKGITGLSGRGGVYKERARQVDMANAQSSRDSLRFANELISIDERLAERLANLDKYESHSLLSMMRAQERFLAKNPELSIFVWIGRIVIVILELLALLHGMKEPVGASFYVINTQIAKRRKEFEDAEFDRIKAFRDNIFQNLTGDYEKIRNTESYEKLPERVRQSVDKRYGKYLRKWISNKTVKIG